MHTSPLLKDFEPLLRIAFDRHTSHAQIPQVLKKSVEYSLFAPGKRIRPRLCLSTAKMLQLAPEAAIAAACAIEMVHCYTLIHDDLPCLDNSDTRRGRPSNHKQFNEATALLAGDCLMALANDALLDAEPYVNAKGLIQAIKRLNTAQGIRGVIAGQAAEPLLTASSTLDDLRSMHRLKTGALFSAALLLPADLSGITSNPDTDSLKMKNLEHFCDELGLAFQAVDDIEDQEQDLGAEAPPERGPTSILFYLPVTDVRALSIERLQRAKRELVHEWGEAATPIADISEEVLKRLGSIT